MEGSAGIPREAPPPFAFSEPVHFLNKLPSVRFREREQEIVGESFCILRHVEVGTHIRPLSVVDDFLGPLHADHSEIEETVETTEDCALGQCPVASDFGEEDGRGAAATGLVESVYRSEYEHVVAKGPIVSVLGGHRVRM